MTKNIVDAYRKVVNKYERGDFHDVLSFCENDNECRDYNSLKKNVLIFWSYKNIAEYYEKEKKYIKAYDFWLKAWNVAFNSSFNALFGSSPASTGGVLTSAGNKK